MKDGLFLEGKEIVGGYVGADVANLDEALATAKSWPGGGTVEIRPVIQQAHPLRKRHGLARVGPGRGLP